LIHLKKKNKNGETCTFILFILFCLSLISEMAHLISSQGQKLEVVRKAEKQMGSKRWR
jgi:hypothetical protein